MKKCLSFIALAFMMMACAPTTKEEYLENYKAFIEEISENSSSYTEADWAEKAEEYAKFTGEWYNKFESEFTLSEKMQVAANAVSYNYHKGCSNVKETIDELGKEYEDEIEQIEEGVEQVTEEVSKAADELGKEIEKLYEEAIK